MKFSQQFLTPSLPESNRQQQWFYSSHHEQLGSQWCSLSEDIWHNLEGTYVPGRKGLKHFKKHCSSYNSPVFVKIQKRTLKESWYLLDEVKQEVPIKGMALPTFHTFWTQNANFYPCIHGMWSSVKRPANWIRFKILWNQKIPITKIRYNLLTF